MAHRPSRTGASVAIALDRLDRRRHTFGLLLEALISALHSEATDVDLQLVRHRSRADIRVDGVAEIILPRLFDRSAVYSRVGMAWLRKRGARVVHFPFLFAPENDGRLRTVVTIHGASRAALDEAVVSRFSERELERLRRRLARVDRILTVSESARDEVVEHYGVDRSQVTVVYNGVGAEFGRAAANPAVLEKYGITTPYLLTVSTLKPKKNVATSVRVFAALLARRPDLPHSLVLVGYKAAGYNEVDRAIAELGLGNRVVQTGWTESREIPAFYAGADLLLFPTLHEGFGLPVVEAMASGVPVAASRVCSIPEVGGDAILTFDPADESEIVARVEQALFDGALREDLVARGLERARRFTWEKAARETASVYRELLTED